MNTARKLRELRQLKRMSQEELAYKIGVSQVTIGKWEQGTSIKHEHLKKLSQTLEVPIEYLLEEKAVKIAPKIENSTNNYVGYEVNVENNSSTIEELLVKINVVLEKIANKL